MQKCFVITQICCISARHTSSTTHHAKHNTPASVESRGCLTYSELGRKRFAESKPHQLHEKSDGTKDKQVPGLVGFFDPFLS